MSEALIGQIIAALVVLIPAILGYLKLKKGQEDQDKKVDELKVQTDGKMNALLKATNAEHLLTGQLQALASGSAQEMVDANKEEKARTTIDVKPGTAIPVIITDQEKTIKVTETKEDKK